MRPIDIERSQVEILLQQMNLADLLPNLRLLRVRERSRVWGGRLLSEIGDGDIEIITYDVSADPGLIVELEEEKETLRTFAQMVPRWAFMPELVLDRHIDGFTFLVTVDPGDAHLIRLLMESRTRSKANQREWITDLAYQPQLDRISGGDYLYEKEGVLIKITLMSATRAHRIIEDTNTLAQEYIKSFGGSIFNLKDTVRLPFPLPLAVVTLNGYPVENDGQQSVVSIEELLAVESLALAPQEYRELAQLHAAISVPETIDSNPPDTAEACQELARQLFSTIACGHHKLGASFTQGAGSSLLSEFVTPAGQLNDLYYLMLPHEGAENDLVAESKLRDMVNALALLWQVAHGDEDKLRVMFVAAVEAYFPFSYTPETLRQLASDLAGDISRFRLSPIAPPPLVVLAQEFLSATSSAMDTSKLAEGASLSQEPRVLEAQSDSFGKVKPRRRWHWFWRAK